MTACEKKDPTNITARQLWSYEDLTLDRNSRLYRNFRQRGQMSILMPLAYNQLGYPRKIFDGKEGHCL
jgi:hypothetical protein